MSVLDFDGGVPNNSIRKCYIIKCSIIDFTDYNYITSCNVCMDDLYVKLSKLLVAYLISIYYF